MAKNREPVLKRAKALGIAPQYMGVNKKSKRQVQQSRRRKSEYGVQLNEKQKVKFLYGLQEKQFRTTFEKASKRPGSAGENLLIMLESRFDNVVFRMGFAATRREARQLVNHGHFLVNGKKANIPSMELKPGDVVTVKEKSQSSPKFKELKDMVITTPKWIEINMDKFEGKIVAAPAREDVDLPIEEHYIVEFYSR
ncbi:MAG: 30S ribosomal protein S4 [Eubacteriales bacterium]|jgi:small subunit ribosomal protein S4|uniref:30S ribosomal protein S4 n=1 Tax=Baileyella intestinalis TaxID=2606709 RepID=UPI0022E1524B|nr:30S ribosomal protein S4 [Baileyella intestinalis]MCI7685787.1 30S ribosomal protein S4 [Clostridiales bacterium]MDD5874679.1 30S ribosomal protein S4 [Baileyella intestinalis]MDY2994294.1 30S ribosomal protein S4 [Baileyella intestinalis]